MAVAVWDIKQNKERMEVSLGARVHLHEEITYFHQWVARTHRCRLHPKVLALVDGWPTNSALCSIGMPFKKFGPRNSETEENRGEGCSSYLKVYSRHKPC